MSTSNVAIGSNTPTTGTGQLANKPKHIKRPVIMQNSIMEGGIPDPANRSEHGHSPNSGPAFADQGHQMQRKAVELLTQIQETLSPEHGIRQKTIDLLKEISQKLSTTGRIDQSTRARFWDMYKQESEEFHADFLQKFSGDLDNSLIFAGLFCGVDATFAALMQPNLGPDPNVTTQVLLMIIAHSLNSTAFSNQDLMLPQFGGPTWTTVWVQSLLYASLVSSLFAALAAMVGKQWLSHYASVGEKGTTEQRCVDRQLKSVGLQTWYFHVVLACIPLLLQASLVLFIIGMAGYLWDQQRTLAAVLIAAGLLIVIFYTFTVVSSLLYSDCPFHTPITGALSILLRRTIIRRKYIREALARLYQRTRHRTLTCGKYLKHLWDLFRSSPQATVSWRHSGPPILPMNMGEGHSISEVMEDEKYAKLDIVDIVRRGPRHSLLTPTNEAETPSRDAGHPGERQEFPPEHQEVDASCISWLLVTSTHPDVVTTAARRVLEVSWMRTPQVDPLPMLTQLRDAFISCFVLKRWLNHYELLPHCSERAFACGQAILHVYFHRARSEKSPGMHSTTADIEKFIKESGALSALCRANNVPTDNSDLYFVLQGLLALTDPSYLFSNDRLRESQVKVNTSAPLDEWISEQTLLCLSNPNTPDHLRLYLLDVICGQFRRGLDVSYRHLYYRYFLAGACGMGHQLERGALSRPSLSESTTEEALGIMLSQITNQLSSLSDSNTAPNHIHITFAWEILGSIADVVGNGSFLEVLVAQKLHHSAIRLCRMTLQLLVIDPGNQIIPVHVWRWLETWLRISVLAGNSSGKWRRAMLAKDERLRGLGIIWQFHSHDLDRNSLGKADIDWLVCVAKGAGLLITRNLFGNSEVDLPGIMAHSLVLLSVLCEAYEVPGGCVGVSELVPMALGQGGILAQAGLKVARAMSGGSCDIMSSPVLDIGSVERFSRLLSQCAYTFYQSDNISARKPESYLVHMAYLDFVHVLPRYDPGAEDGDLKWEEHVRNCLKLASFLGTTTTPGEGWNAKEASMVQTCLGRETEDRPWKTGSRRDISNGVYQNTYVRDVWCRLVQIVARYIQDHSLQSLLECKQEHIASETMFTLACACWHIHSTHPLPVETLRSMTALMQEVLTHWTDTDDVQVRIQLILPFFTVIYPYLHYSNAVDKIIWFKVAEILRSHVDHTSAKSTYWVRSYDQEVKRGDFKGMVRNGADAKSDDSGSVDKT